MAKVYRDYYQFLEIPSSATFEQVKEAYKKKLIQYHPDKQEYGTEEEKKEAKKNLEIAKDALNTLTNEQSREAYDLERRRRSYTSKSTQNSRVNSDYEDIFDAMFRSSFSSFFTSAYSKPQEEEFDFSEIKELDCKIEKIEKEIEEIRKEFEELNTLRVQLGTEQMRHSFKRKIQQDSRYREAVEFIHQFHRKENNYLTKKFIKSADLEKYKHYTKIKEALDEQIAEYERDLIEKIKEAQRKMSECFKKLDEKRKLYSKLKNKYDLHPLRYEYQKYKREQEALKRRKH